MPGRSPPQKFAAARYLMDRQPSSLCQAVVTDFIQEGHLASHIFTLARTDPNAPKHKGITYFIVDMHAPGIEIRPIWTMGDERTNEVYFDDVWVSDEYVVGELNRGFQYISEALDIERFTLFMYSPVARPSRLRAAPAKKRI